MSVEVGVGVDIGCGTMAGVDENAGVVRPGLELFIWPFSKASFRQIEPLRDDDQNIWFSAATPNLQHRHLDERVRYGESLRLERK